MSTPYKQVALYTNTGRHLTPHEDAFITAFIACKNLAQSVVQAGYRSKKPAQYDFKNQLDFREERREKYGSN